MSRRGVLVETALVALTLFLSACSTTGGEVTSTSGTTAAGATSSAAAPSTASTAAAPAEQATGGNDACAALPRATIEEVVGADPGEGELQHAGASSSCNYYGDAQVTVEIDPGTDLAGAQTSIEAYGDTCQDSNSIGDRALFCTGGMPAKGLTGQLVWTDGRQLYYVVYNFGDTTPSEDTVLALAQRLQP